VSRETTEASAAALKQLLERRFDEVELLIIYIDGMHFGEQCVLAAVGVDVQGRKHVLALRAGGYSSSTARRLCVPRSTRCLEPTRRYKGVGTTSCAMCWDDFRASSKRRPRR